MGFLFSFLYFVGFILYVIAGIAGICFLLSDKNNKFAIYLFIALIFFGAGGFFLRSYVEDWRKNYEFNEQLETGDSKNVLYAFRKLSEVERTNHIYSIYDSIYTKDFSGQYEFLKDYNNYPLPFVDSIRIDFCKKVEVLYDKAERINTKQSWKNFLDNIPCDFFITIMTGHLREREEKKWETDDGCWNRVLLLDSITMAKQYLSIYPKGKYDFEARRMILDAEYSNFSPDNKRNRGKVTNYSGYTTISIRNSSSTRLVFSYSGTFGRDNVEVDAYGSKTITVQNGYYHIYVHSNTSRTKSISESVTYNGGYIPYEYYLSQGY